MKVGDIVKHKLHPEKYGVGKIISFQAKMGTVLVKFENLTNVSYQLPWMLIKESK